MKNEVKAENEIKVNASDVQWLKEHFFEKSTPNDKFWRLEAYNGLFIWAGQLAGGHWRAYATFNNEYCRAVTSEHGPVHPSAAAAVGAALKEMKDDIAQFAVDMGVTEKALNRKLDYAEFDEGFYEGMPELEDGRDSSDTE